MEPKKCTKCGGDRDGKRSWCKACQSAARRVRYWADPEKSKDSAREWTKNNRSRVLEKSRAWKREHVAEVMLCSAKSRAKRAGLPFSLSVEDIEIPEVCPLLGIPLFLAKRVGPRRNSPSLDRIDPSKGYVPGNVWVISMRANAIKQDATADEIEEVARGLRRMLTKRKMQGSASLNSGRDHEGESDRCGGAAPSSGQDSSGGP